MEYTLSVLNDPTRIPELIELFRTGLGETTQAYWKWRLFTDNGQPDRPIAIVAETGENSIVGMMCILPVLYRTQNGYIKCAQIGDWVIHPNHRGCGIAKKIYSYVAAYLSSQKYDFILGFPNGNSYPILKKYGFDDLTGVTCWNTADRVFLSASKKKNNFEYEGMIYRFSEQFPEVDMYAPGEGCMLKNASFLKWKYDWNPNGKYTWLTLWQEGRCIGYFVYLMTRGRLRTAVNVYDWAYVGAESKYFKYAVDLLRAKGNFVSFWGRYPSEENRLLGNANLHNRSKSTVCIVKAIGGSKVPDLRLTRIDTDY